MSPCLKTGLVGLVLMSLAAGAGTGLRAELYYEGGFVYRAVPGGRAGDYAPRFEHHPPMQFHYPYPGPWSPGYSSGQPGGYRFYSPRAYDSTGAQGAATPAPAPGGPPDDRGPAADRSRNLVSFEDRDEPPAAPGNVPVGAAEKYSLEASHLPQRGSAEEADVAILVAYLPEDAALWVEGVQTRSEGRTRYFESPPLPPGKTFRYAVKAVWREDGRWVSQTREVVVRAGEVHRVYLRASASDRIPPGR